MTTPLSKCLVMKLKRSHHSLTLVGPTLIKGVASLEGENLLEFCYIASQCIWNLAWWQVIFGRSGLIKGMIFGGSGLIKGMVFGGSGLIKGMVFGGSGLIRGLFISMINFFSLESSRYIVYLHLNSWLIEQVGETCKSSPSGRKQSYLP